MLGKKLWNRLFLYKAVKHEVLMHQAEHGFSLVELWDVVNGKQSIILNFGERLAAMIMHSISKPDY